MSQKIRPQKRKTELVGTSILLAVPICAPRFRCHNSGQPAPLKLPFEETFTVENTAALRQPPGKCKRRVNWAQQRQLKQETIQAGDLACNALSSRKNQHEPWWRESSKTRGWIDRATPQHALCHSSEQQQQTAATEAVAGSSSSHRSTQPTTHPVPQAVRDLGENADHGHLFS